MSSNLGWYQIFKVFDRRQQDGIGVNDSRSCKHFARLPVGSFNGISLRTIEGEGDKGATKGRRKGKILGSTQLRPRKLTTEATP
jgi:hypothetical protein